MSLNISSTFKKYPFQTFLITVMQKYLKASHKAYIDLPNIYGTGAKSISVKPSGHSGMYGHFQLKGNIIVPEKNQQY